MQSTKAAFWKLADGREVRQAGQGGRDGRSSSGDVHESRTVKKEDELFANPLISEKSCGILISRKE